MGKLISVHTTPIWRRWLALLVSGFGLWMLGTGLVHSNSLLLLYGLLFTPGPLLANGLPGYSAISLEVYEEGLVFRWLWRKRAWHWSEFDGISDTHRDFLVRLWTSGKKVVDVKSLSNMRQAQRQITARVVRAIYRKLVDKLKQGDVVWADNDLQIGIDGLTIMDQAIRWHEIRSVKFNGKWVKIVSPLIKLRQHRYDFNMYKSRNGIVHAQLIYRLWEDAVESAPAEEIVCIVIDGVAFNSEGEMIGGGE